MARQAPAAHCIAGFSVRVIPVVGVLLWRHGGWHLSRASRTVGLEFVPHADEVTVCSLLLNHLWVLTHR